MDDVKGKGKATAMDETKPTFASLDPPLSPIILSALSSSLSLSHPTPVQSQFIPLALTGKDVLVRARTGSGKTLAYALPIVQSILEEKARRGATDVDRQATRAVVLVPTRELSEQVTAAIGKLCRGLGPEGTIKVVNIAGGGKGDKLQKLQLADRPDIVVSTPSRLLAHLRSSSLSLSSVSHLVLDEADLILSYGHSSDDIRSILSGSGTDSSRLPPVYQSFLMSATLTSEVEELKGVVLRNEPVVLDIPETASELSDLSQFSVRCSEEDKFLLLYVILRLKLVKGKSLIFVNSTDRSYRLKLFLEKFGIRSGVLNAELPFNSRYHAVEEFNRGVFDYLIATDESGMESVERDAEEDVPEEELISTQADNATTSAPTKKRKRADNATKTSGASEYGVSRGIDFIDVSCVLNFDLPTSSRSYIHRIGRTARAGRTGMALSFVVPRSLWQKKAHVEISLPSAKRDEEVWKRIERKQKEERGVEVEEYRFDMEQVEGFRYRMMDGLRGVTRAAVREARIREIKNEVLNSEKLKAHFEQNPDDLAFLKHDKPLHPSRVQPHLKHVPSYLMPRIAAVGPSTATSSSSSAAAGETKAGEGEVRVGFHKAGRGRGGKGGRGGRGGGRGGRGGSRGGKKDPLKHFALKKSR